MYRFNFSRQLCSCLIMLALAGISLPALAEERILSYHSDIDINSDGSLRVTETITVNAESDQIKRGIYREFPTDYKDRFGNRYRTTFDLLEVTRNGSAEAHHTETRSNGVVLYAGSRSQLLQPGVHEYRFTYSTKRQIGFFEEYDELYWNVTGNDWVLPIDSASATIRLPSVSDSNKFRTAIYTGTTGSIASDAISEVVNSSSVRFSTRFPLAPGEGLTVAFGFPKGLVVPPAGSQVARWFFQDNSSVLVLIIGWLACLGWYGWFWNKKGRDPQKGVIIPRFTPPTGISPAGTSYIPNMGLRKSAFTAAVISLGIKGHIEIEDDDGAFKLRKRNAFNTQELSDGEQVVMEALLPEGTNYIALDNNNHAEFGKAKSELSSALETEFKGRLFNLNTIYAVPALIVTVLTMVAAAIMGTAGPVAWALFIVTMVAMHILFIFLLRAPTIAGRRVMDEIEGFQMYLETAERDRLEQMQSPKLTPEVFESFLPYAFAQGVENAWCKRFAGEFPELHRTDGAYHPSWYSGNLRGVGAMHHISSGLNSELTQAISSAGTPPGSSSGSGGGGSSGGGGGGGGGGGW